MRNPHLLRPNHGNEMPWEAIWIDTETVQVPVATDTVKHVLAFGWAAYRRRLNDREWSEPRWFRFHSIAGLWDWVESLVHGKSRLYLFAHNCAFDLPVLDAFEQLPLRGWKLTKAVIDSPPVILKWRKAGSTIEAIDTLNLWRQSLAAVGSVIEQHKLDMPESWGDRGAGDVYCRRDVEVIMAMCLSWWEFLVVNDLGGFAPTIASQALRTYRHRFMRDVLYVDDDVDALALARAAYHGGRVECYRMGDIVEPMSLLDINSLYPSVMLDTPMPVRLVRHTRMASVRDLTDWVSWSCVVARVAIETDEPIYPVVHEGRLCFPVGRFEASLTTPELVLALERGDVRAVYEVAVYESAVIFRDFIVAAWDARMAALDRGDKLYGQHWKYLMNSLYGKFGQNGRVYVDAGESPDRSARLWYEFDADTGDTYKCRSLGGLLQKYRDEGESRDSMPAIAAHVTAAGRVALWRMQCQAGRDNVYYGDTDSLLVNRAGGLALASHLDDRRLGGLKVELELDHAVIAGAKDYRVGSRAKTKGVSGKALWIGPDDVQQEQWTTLIGLLRLGDLSAPRTKRVTKHLSREYLKGRVQPDGRVLPLVLPA